MHKVSYTSVSEYCLTEEQMQMHGSEFERYIQRYIFPCLVVFGILIDTLNLTVLLDKKIRSRANTFLVALAIVDIIFFALLIPNILANYSFFAFNFFFRLMYFNAKVQLIAFANWASAVALWCVIAVCADRLIGIKNPFYARARFSTQKMSLILGSIVLFTGLLIAHQAFAYECRILTFCNGTQLHSKCLPINAVKWFRNQSNPYSPHFQTFIEVNIVLNIVLIIIFPIILLTILNILLLYFLRKRASQLFLISDGSGSTKGGFAESQAMHQRTEQRVTFTVTFIVTAFTLTNDPSAVMHLLLIATDGDQKRWYDIVLFCNMLVIIGKASNFVLFCLSSKHFRAQLLSVVREKMHDKFSTIREGRAKGPPFIIACRNRAASTASTLLPTEQLQQSRNLF